MWLPVGSLSPRANWQTFDQPIVGSELLRVAQTFDQPVAGYCYLAQYFASQNGLGLIKRLYFSPDTRILEFRIPPILKDQNLGVYSLQIKLSSSFGGDFLHWFVSVEAYYG